MQNIMDTEYGLSIPMHRPFISPDASFDSPLPCRKDFKQVTALNADNLTPYQIPKDRQLSVLEQLPLEIRLRIYHHCDLHSLTEACNTRLFAFLDHTDGWRDKSFCSPYMSDTRHSLLYINRHIQAEL